VCYTPANRFICRRLVSAILDCLHSPISNSDGDATILAVVVGVLRADANYFELQYDDNPGFLAVSYVRSENHV